MKKNIKELISRRDSFIISSSLFDLMEKYENNEMSSEDFLENIKVFVPIAISLPSGRFGNIFALALETHKFDIAELIYDNAKELGLNLKKTILTIGGCEPWTAGEEVAYADATWPITKKTYTSTIDIYDKKYDKDNDILFVRKKVDALNRLYKKLKAPTEYKGMDIEPIILDRFNREITHFVLSMLMIKEMVSYESNLIDKESLINQIGIFDEMIYPLSNGRKGNILALALNMNLFKSAKAILENKDKIRISIKSVSHDVSGKEKENDIIDEISDSILTYSIELLKEKISVIKTLASPETATSLINTIIEENEALEDVFKICGISKEEPGMGTK